MMAGDQLGRYRRLLQPERWLDAGVIAVAWTIALMGTSLTSTSERDHLRSLVLVLVGTVGTAVLLDRRAVYERSPRVPRVEETSRTATAVLGGTTGVALAGAITDFRLGAKELLFAGFLVLVGIYVGRGYFRRWSSQRAGGHDGQVERIVVIGAGEEARELVDLIDEHPESNLFVLGIVGDELIADRHGLSNLWLGPPEQVVDVMRRHHAASAVVNTTGFRGHRFRQITRELLRNGFVVRISTGVTRLYCGRLDVKSLVHEPLISVEPQVIPQWELRMKRWADIIGASVALVLAFPVMALTAAAIKLEDGGPVLFRQQRTGRGGETFPMMKFRSMVPEAEMRKHELEGHNERSGPLFKMTKDPRVTRVGRIIRETSIDELPQLFNVLRGDMSLVGPRPPLPEEQALFDNELRGRFDVRPGITGLWQVEARSNASFNAYRRLDLQYVENWSLWMDLRILLTTGEQILVALATFPMRRAMVNEGADGITGPHRARAERITNPATVDIELANLDLGPGLSTAPRQPALQSTARAQVD